MFLVSFGLLLVLASSVFTQKQCNQCGSQSNVACISETRFHFCFDGNPNTAEISECPANSVCVDSPKICEPKGTASCISECGKCGPDGKFACLSQNTFALCFGNSEPSNTIHTCPIGMVCKNSASNFCIDPATESSSCAVGEEVTPPSPKKDDDDDDSGDDSDSDDDDDDDDDNSNKDVNPDEYCKKKTAGRYPVPGDKRQQKYIYCYPVDGKKTGKIFSCPRGRIFNSRRELCIQKSN